MSNNRFLNPKENNRFNFLNDEDDTNKSSSYPSNKSNRKKFEYEASTNSFTQPSNRDRDLNRDRGYNRDRDLNRDRGYNRDRDLNRDRGYRDRGYRDTGYNRDYDRTNNRFKTDTKEQLPQTKLDFNDTELFPELIGKKESDNNSDKVNDKVNMSGFKDILNNIIEDTTEKTKKIPPGWIQISMVDRKVVIENGEPTLSMINTEEQEDNININYNMNIIVDAIKRNYEENERVYDSINGEGSYSERFKLQSVYGSEYDTESEEDDYVNNEDDGYYDE
jgi:hypothetical protein